MFAHLKGSLHAYGGYPEKSSLTGRALYAAARSLIEFSLRGKTDKVRKGEYVWQCALWVYLQLLHCSYPLRALTPEWGSSGGALELSLFHKCTAMLTVWSSNACLLDWRHGW